MVRKGELACRDGWSRDLWAPRGDAGATNQQETETRPGALPPVSADEMSALVDQGQIGLEATPQPPAPAPVDVVVGEAPALSLPDDRATLLSKNPRAAIEEARKRHLAKSAGVGESPVERDAGAEASGPPTNAHDDQPDSPPSIGRRSTPSRPAPVAPPLKLAGQGPSVIGQSHRPDEHRFSAVPDVVDGVELPRRQDQPVEPRIAGATEDLPADPRRASLDRLRQRQSRSPQPPGMSQLEPAPEPATDWPDEPPRLHEGGRPSWRGLFGRERRSQADSAEDDERSWEEHWPVEDAEAYETDEFQSDVETDRLYAPTNDDVESPDADELLEYVSDEDLDIAPDFVDTSVHAAPGVPRMCRTCRDYRPADSGERGWCNNKWAFSHRRMVDADELPCESSLGCWWLPHDEVWLSTADAAAHSEPTPLVDQWLSRREEAVRRRQGS